MKLINFIKEKLKRLFNKNKMLVDSKNSFSEEKVEYKDNEEEKKMFFELYKKVKSGKIKMEQLTINDLLKLQLIIGEENNMLEDKLIKEESEIEQLDIKINYLNAENKRMNSKM